MSIRRGTGLLAIAALAGIALRAEPAGDEPRQMDDVVITATRSETSTREIPANVTVITARDIADGNYSDVVGVLQSLGGLHFRSFSGNQEATVDIRGFGENSHGRVLILRDGRRLNRPDMRGINWSQIPLASIERIEILRGPGGAIYGDNAVGGVINIITKKGAAEPTGEVVVEGGSQSYNRQALSLLGNLAGLDYALSLERSETSGWRHRTGTRTEGGDLSLGYDLAEGLRLDVNLALLHTEYEMPGGLLSKAAFEANPRAAQNLFDEAAEDYFTINPTLTAQLAETVEFILETGYSRKDIETDTVSWFTWSDLLVETWTVSPRFVFTAPLGDFANRLTIGVDWTYESLAVKRYFDAGRTVYGGGADVTKDTLAVYFHDALNLTDSVILSFGARHARSTFAVEEENGLGVTIADDDDSHREQAYHLGLTWNATETTKLFAKYEHFFRFPFTDEQISYQGWGSAFNKNLGPETGVSYEIGIEQRLPGSVTVAATLFRMEMEDEIGWDSVFFTNANLDETVHQGLELSLRAEPWEFLSCYANYTYQDVEFSAGPNDGNELPLVPKHQLGGGVQVRPFAGFRVNLDARYTSRMFEGGDNANALDRMDDYVVVDLGLAYSFPVRDTTWEVFGGIDNLFDEIYTNFVYYGGYYAAPGRTYKAGVKVAF